MWPKVELDVVEEEGQGKAQGRLNPMHASKRIMWSVLELYSRKVRKMKLENLATYVAMC